jgi:hypothetical protein
MFRRIRRMQVGCLVSVPGMVTSANLAPKAPADLALGLLRQMESPFDAKRNNRVGS